MPVSGAIAFLYFFEYKLIMFRDFFIFYINIRIEIAVQLIHECINFFSILYTI